VRRGLEELQEVTTAANGRQANALDDYDAEHLIAPERVTVCFSNLFVRSLVEWRSPAPGEFDRWALH
jgi:hypothetical protein